MSTRIEWADETWNPIIGCDRVSAGCDNCYAIPMARVRAGNPHPAIAAAFAGVVDRIGGRIDWTGQVNMRADRLDLPLRKKKPLRIFVNSGSDLFHKAVTDEFIARIFAVMIVADWHRFQVLTKRHGRMEALLASSQFWAMVARFVAELRGVDDDQVEPLTATPHWIWIGVSVENQKYADLRIPALLRTPATTRWISAEPLLGPIVLAPEWVLPPTGRGHCSQPVAREDCAAHPGAALLSWVVYGGESGPRARPMHPDWARGLRDQCQRYGVPQLFKQWGEHLAVRLEADPSFAGGRAYTHPTTGSRSAAIIREPTTRAFTPGVTRRLRTGDRTGAGQMLDDDTLAVRVGKSRAGRELDGRTWDEYPATATSAESRR